MNARQYLIIVVLLATGAALVAGSSVGLGMSLSNTEEEVTGQSLQTDDDTQDENTSGMGKQVTSFMQSTAVDVNNSVESGIWEASVNSSENASEIVNQRVDSLEDRLSALQNKSERLDEMRANGSTGLLHSARASSVRAKIANLKSAIIQTGQTARRVGVNVTKLEQLRQNASNMTGPEVSEVARNITDAPNNASKTGPPGNLGNGNQTGPPEDPGNGNETGPPEDSGNGNETGPPEDPGNGNETGPPEDPGNGNETSPPEDPGNGNETGPPENPGNGNKTGPPEDPGDNEESGQNGEDENDGSGPPENPGADEEDDEDGGQSANLPGQWYLGDQ
jgi:hypothetical protein